MVRRRQTRGSKPMPGTDGIKAVRPARGSRERLPLVLLVGVLLVGAALWLRSSSWMREQLVRGKTVPELEAAVRADPRDDVSRYALAKRYYTSQRFAEAEAAYRDVIQREPRSARSHLGLALSLYELSRLEAATEEFEQALTLDPKLAWAEYMLGKIAWLRGRVGEAIPHVKRATELDPRSGPAWYALGVCHLQQRRYDDAIGPLQRAIALEDGNPRYHTALGEVLVYRGRVDEGRTHLERGVQLDPSYGPACALAGNFYLRKAADPDAMEKAEALLLRATKLKTYHPEQVYLDLGDLYFQNRQYRKALTALQESVRLDPRDERPYFTLARVYRRLGDDEAAARAEARFTRISKLHVQMQAEEARLFHDPSNSTVRLRLARVYREIGLVSQAAAAYSAYLSANPTDRKVETEFRTWIEAHTTPPPREQPRDFVAPPLR